MHAPGSSLNRSRRWFLGTALGGLGSAVAWSFPRAGELTSAVAPSLLDRARTALDLHRDVIEHRDLIAISLGMRLPDFSLACSLPLAVPRRICS